MRSTQTHYIRHPVNLSVGFMEGSYSKVWNAREEARRRVKFFVDSLMGNHSVSYFLLVW